MVTPAAKRAVVRYLLESYRFSERRACLIVGLCRGSYRYQAKPKNDEAIKKRLRELAELRRRFGSSRLHILLRREGYLINHKRTERLYKEEGCPSVARRAESVVAMFAWLWIAQSVPINIGRWILFQTVSIAVDASEF